MSTAEAYIVDAVRTPVGRKNGGLGGVHPVDLGAHTITALIDRIGLNPGLVDDVMFGCVDPVGPQAGDIARWSWLAAGYPTHVPGVTIDRACGSAQQAISFAAQSVMSGVNHLVVAGGVQNMSVVPIGHALTAGQALAFSDPFSGSEQWRLRFGDEEVSQFRGAELIAEQWDITRQQMEAFAFESHQRAIRAQDEGRFDNEIVPVGNVVRDECPRRDSTMERMETLRPLVEGGRLTAAVSSQISDGACSMLIASEQALRAYGLKPRARIHHMTVLADDPISMLRAPIPATRKAFDRTGMSVDDIDLFECNEAFAPVVLAWMKDLGIPHEKVNVNGGAIALGHPLGATGARLMTTLLNELERSGGRWGLQTMCEGGGQANVTIVERL